MATSIAYRMKIEDQHTRMIEVMIANYEAVDKNYVEMLNSLEDPRMDPMTRAITQKCAAMVSDALDSMWKEIMECQQMNLKIIKQTRVLIERAIKAKP